MKSTASKMIEIVREDFTDFKIIRQELNELKIQLIHEGRKIVIGFILVIVSLLAFYDLHNNTSITYIQVYFSLFSITFTIFITGMTLIINGFTSNAARTEKFNNMVLTELQKNSEKLDLLFEKLVKLECKETPPDSIQTALENVSE